MRKDGGILVHIEFKPHDIPSIIQYLKVVLSNASSTSAVSFSSSGWDRYTLSSILSLSLTPTHVNGPIVELFCASSFPFACYTSLKTNFTVFLFVTLTLRSVPQVLRSRPICYFKSQLHICLFCFFNGIKFGEVYSIVVKFLFSSNH